MKEKLKWYNKVWVKAIIAVVVIVIIVASSFVYYIWSNAFTPGNGSPMINATIEKEGNNWTGLIWGPSRPNIEIQQSSFVIKRGNLTLVSFTFNDKRPGDPINSTRIEPVTGNLTNYEVYTLMKEGYTIYFYDVYDNYRGFFNGGDRIYIVNNGLRSGDVFEILYDRPCDHYLFTLWSNSWEGGLP